MNKRIKKKKQEQLILSELDRSSSHFDNRDFFYLAINNNSLKFKDQEECDNLLSLLIKSRKIDKKRIGPDPGIFKPNKTLEEALKQ